MYIIVFVVLGIYLKVAWFVVTWNPWFHRGGDYNMGIDTGVFAFNHNHGHANVNDSFRVVFLL